MSIKLIGDKNHEKIALNTVLNEKNIAQEISDDDNDDDEEVDETEGESLSFTESLKMLDKINRCSFWDEESHKMLSTVTKKLENLQHQNKKQKSITYFSWFQSTKIPVLLTLDFCFEVVTFDLLFWNKHIFHFSHRVLSLPYETH